MLCLNDRQINNTTAFFLNTFSLQQKISWKEKYFKKLQACPEICHDVPVGVFLLVASFCSALLVLRSDALQILPGQQARLRTRSSPAASDCSRRAEDGAASPRWRALQEFLIALNKPTHGVKREDCNSLRSRAISAAKLRQDAA